jgi:hypothetical protein
METGSRKGAGRRARLVGTVAGDNCSPFFFVVQTIGEEIPTNGQNKSVDPFFHQSSFPLT